MTKWARHASVRARTTVLLAAGLCALLTTSALAAGGNSVHNQAPGHVTVGQSFKVHLIGHAKSTAWLYLWLDSKACTATPAGEHKRLGGYAWTVTGSFDKASGWKATAAGTTHVCSYLSKRSEPENSPHGVLARDFTTIKQT
ncbi:MAG TPA: hypothetical protein VE983_12775 [Solirubrobacteraceae bacterium]|nr:hypothetical protein [Solirubrobacteraceae bacterium]